LARARHEIASPPRPAPRLEEEPSTRDEWVTRAFFGLLGNRSRIGSVDLVTSPDLSFLAFYFLPVILASWFLGRREGLATALASVALWTLDDTVSHRHYSHLAIPIWNRSVGLAFFVFLSWLTGSLKVALEREMRARSEGLERDLAMARDVQAALLPTRWRDGNGFAVAAECRQAFGVGGDAYDLESLGSDALAVAVADVSGKGMPAALLMASFLASLRGLLSLQAGHLDILAEELSERLRTSLDAPRFVTAFIGVVEDGALRYVNAGHEAGLLFPPGADAAGAVRLRSTGPALGILPGARFREARVAFPRDSLLVLFTDGLTECANGAGDEFGATRVAEAAAFSSGAAPIRIVEGLLRAAETHAAGEPFSDDVTIVCVRRSAAKARRPPSVRLAYSLAGRRPSGKRPVRAVDQA
jgi:serine phosphatase RsbU (regulator of sigma subunit)